MLLLSKIKNKASCSKQLHQYAKSCDQCCTHADYFTDHYIIRPRCPGFSGLFNQNMANPTCCSVKYLKKSCM